MQHFDELRRARQRARMIDSGLLVCERTASFPATSQKAGGGCLRVDGDGLDIRGAAPRRSGDEARDSPETRRKISWAGHDVGR